MQVTFVKDSQNHIHHKHREKHEDRQIADRGAEGLGFALQARAQGRRDNFSSSFNDKVGGVAQGDAWLEIERERDARELVQMVHRLEAKGSLPRYQRVEWHEAFAIVGLDV